MTLNNGTYDHMPPAREVAVEVLAIVGPENIDVAHLQSSRIERAIAKTIFPAQARPVVKRLEALDVVIDQQRMAYQDQNRMNGWKPSARRVKAELWKMLQPKTELSVEPEELNA